MAMGKDNPGISSLGTVRTFFKTGTCSETLCSVLDRAYGQPLAPEEHAAAPLAGGIIGQGYQCGQLWGAAMAAGARAYQLFGPGPRAEAAAVRAAQRLVAAFRVRNKEINCLELTDGLMKNTTASKIWKFFVKGGPVRCFAMAARTANAAYPLINAALSENPAEVPPGPLSCAALLARRLGLSDLQVTMAAGLAAGIGLSGGACGVFGAAVWILGLQPGMQPDQPELSFSISDNPRASAIMERFLESSDYEFECCKITGRQFTDVSEHAAYLRTGGCAKIIEALAVPL